jgi:hypothetical protein
LRKVARHEFSTRMLRDYSSAEFCDTAADAELAGILAAGDMLMRSMLDSIFMIWLGVGSSRVMGQFESSPIGRVPLPAGCTS